MSIEQYTEKLTLKEMKCNIGENEFGYVFPQGDVSVVEKIENLLKKAGGKPKECEISDLTQGGNGKAKPEFIITFNDDISTIIVVECKNSVKKHQSEKLNRPNNFAVDGVLYYAKFLKEEYNVIAVAVSGTTKENMKVNTFHWIKGQDTYLELKKVTDIILEPNNYLEFIKGNKLRKAYSLDDIRETAITMHKYLREIKMTERHKPIFIAGLLIALNDEDFSKSYISLPSFSSVIQNIQIAIENVLCNSGIKNNRIVYIKQAFKNLLDNSKFSSIPLGHKKSLLWYIEELEMKIKPMMDYADSTIDALGVFYHEFIKYSGGDGRGLGIVLTPQHLTEFMCNLAGVNKNSRVVDICCGSGSFLITAMSKMFKQANPQETDEIRKKGLYGVEFDDELYTLSIANMIIRKDGKSNIYFGDCFDEKITKELKEKNINIGLINPPYSQEDVSELEFVERLLEILIPGGTGVVVVPMSCAIGTKFKDVRERLFKKNTLKAVFSMPDEIFYPTGTNVCVMVWEAHTPHDTNQKTFFGYCKDDGFVKRKKVGRIDALNRWQDIQNKWIELYRYREVKDGLSAQEKITHTDEWLCEAYMKTSYSELSNKDFEMSIKQYLAFEILNDYTSLESKFEINSMKLKLDLSNWQWFDLIIYFDMYAGKYYNKFDFSSGKTPYVSASDNNNGILDFIDIAPKFKGNSLTIGKVGCTTYYQEFDFCATSDVTVLVPKMEFNKYIGLFMATVINMEHNKWSYGRQIRLGDCKKLIVKLPATPDNKPDWNYMEEYIKSLPLSEKI